MSKLVICACPVRTREVVQPCGGGVWAGGYYRGMVRVGGYGEGNTGTPSHLLEEGLDPSEAGPGSPVGAGVGGDLEPDALCALHPVPTLRARSCPCRALPGTGLRLARLLANKGEINVKTLEC